MAEAVAKHAQASGPQEVREAEQGLRAQANRVAAGLHRGNAGAMDGGVGMGNDQAHLQAEAHRGAAAEHERAADNLARGVSYDDPHRDGYVDPAADPRYADPRADGDVDPRDDDRIR